MTGPEHVEVQWWLSLRQVAQKAGCKPGTVWAAIDAGTLPSVQTGGRKSHHRVRRDHAAAFVAGTHQRWHVERGITSAACELCTRDLRQGADR